jgi:chemotaxis protein methyltransferase CheR
MKPEDFSFLCKLLYERTGLVLGTDKMYLIESRLSPVARKWGMNGLDALTQGLRAGRDTELLRDVSDAMMTNESLFFRDIKPFEQLKQVVLPKLQQTRAQKKVIRIWSAACSTGQEPYTLAMILSEDVAKYGDWKIEIVATDISKEALDRAKAGTYTQFEVQRGLPINMLVKYFKQNGDKWQIDQKLRNMIQFREFNLLQDPGTLGQFDVVFCRNVLIYFDQSTKSGVLDRIAKLLAADGVLYLGGAETVLGVSDKFAPLPGQRGVYGVVADKLAPKQAVRA